MGVVAADAVSMRKIIHVDMDAFFAAVEQRDHPEYRGKPVIVGGSPQSRGVAANKFLAKVASGHRKPDGLTVILPEQSEAFIEALPIGAFYGIGPATEAKMIALGIHTGADLKTWDEAALVSHFGKSGRFYHRIAHGIDDREVESDHVRKSVGAENTFAENLADLDSMREQLREIADTVSRRLLKIPTAGRTITLKVRYADFEIATRSVTLPNDVNDAETLYETAAAALPQTDAAEREVRLLGITVSNLALGKPERSGQLDLGL